MLRVKSVRLRDREVDVVVPEPVVVEPPVVTELWTRQVWVTPPGMVAVMVALPVLVPALTLPVSSTLTTSGSLLVQVMVPVEPSGIKVTVRVMGSG